MVNALLMSTAAAGQEYDENGLQHKNEKKKASSKHRNTNLHALRYGDAKGFSKLLLGKKNLLITRPSVA